MYSRSLKPRRPTNIRPIRSLSRPPIAAPPPALAYTRRLSERPSQTLSPRRALSLSLSLSLSLPVSLSLTLSLARPVPWTQSPKRATPALPEETLVQGYLAHKEPPPPPGRSAIGPYVQACRRVLEGYPAHKNLPPPRTLQ